MIWSNGARSSKTPASHFSKAVMSHTDDFPLVVSPDWLAGRLGQPGLRIIDCTTWMQPNPVGASTMTSARDHWARAHLPGSLHWDLVDDLSCPEAPWPFTRPGAQTLASLLGRSGIAQDDHIVLYGARHPNIVTRAWWVLHSMGLNRVSILDGGFEAWQQRRLPLDSMLPSRPQTRWNAEDFSSRGHADLEKVRAALDTGSPLLVNALSARQFAGDTDEPHYGRPGRIPGSFSLPAASLHHEGRLASPQAVGQAARAAGLPPQNDTPIIVYCGGGLAASMVYFSLYRAGWTRLWLYDNSLLEWAADDSLPMQCEWPQS